MKKLLPLLLFLVPAVSFAQGSRLDDIAFKNLITGLAPAGGATVTVCTSAGTGIPCTPLASIYSDISLTAPFALANPLTADSNGYYGFYAAPGRYVVTVTGAGVSGKSITYILPCDPSGAASASCLTLAANNIFTGSNAFTGGGSFSGTFTGGPTFTISTVSESSFTVTVTTSVPCSIALNQPVRIAGVGVANYNGDFVALSACSGSTFTYSNPISGLGASSGGTVVGAPIWNAVTSFPGLLKTGTGYSTTSGIVGQNQENVCGSAASPDLTLLGTNAMGRPCTHTLYYYGAAAVPPNGFNSANHWNHFIAASGYDVQSGVGSYDQANCNGQNSGGIVNDNSTLCLATVGTALSGLSSTASVVASDFVGKLFTTAPGARLVQASQLLSQTARTPGWYGDTAHDYSPMQTNVIFSGSLGISAYLGMAGAGSVGALTGEFVADTVDTAHAIWHGTSVARPDNGYWCGAAITSCEFIGAGVPYTTNQASTPLYSDSPTYGVIFGERAANSGQSNLVALFSTNAGTSCTLLAAPSGATEVGNTATYTCNAGIAGNFAAGSIAHITGVGQSGYNIDCVIQTVASPAFTCKNSNIYTAQSAVSGASESGSTVTITTSAACPFTTGETVTISNIINTNPTTNTGYNGAFTVLAPGCNGGSTFTYTNTVTGLPTCASAGACTGAIAPVVIGNPLPASGGGTAVASARAAFTEYHDSSNVMHWGYASPPAGNGADQMTLTNGGVATAVSFNSTGNSFVTSIQQAAAFRTATANPSGTGQYRQASADTISWRNNANTADLAYAKNTTDVRTWMGIPEYVSVASDFTTAANTSLQTITGLTWTIPANEAINFPFSCHLMYSQATAVVPAQFGIQDVTVAPTNIAAKGEVGISTSAVTLGNLPTLTTTTATPIVTFTPSVITTVWNADITGFIEQPSNASTSAVNIMVQTSNAADLVTVKRGSFCRVF